MATKLRDALHDAAGANEKAQQDVEDQRRYIRENVSEDVLAFMDGIRERFPNARLEFVRLTDGTEIGREV